MEKTIQDMIKEMQEQYDLVRRKVTEETVRTEEWIAGGGDIKLKTVIVKPIGVSGPYPTIVRRSCYIMQEEFLEAQAQELAKRGFAAVFQWCRGIGESEGVWEPYSHEREDGIPLVKWLQEQEWVKNMGFVGASYLALTGWYLADIIPDKMKTMYLTVMGTETHLEMWQEGAFRQDIFTSWTMGNTGTEITADYLTSAQYHPQVEVDEKLWGCKLQWYRDEISKPSRLDPFWTESHWNTLQEIPAKTKIPVYVGEGWYDIQLGNALKTFEKISPESLAHSVLWVNPGNHGLEPVIYGQKEQGKAAAAEHKQQLAWFKQILMDGELPEPSVNYYLIGADEWLKFDTYPPVGMKEKELFFDGELLAEVSGESSKREYDYDPNNPVKSHGGATMFRLTEEIGSLEQPSINWRPDVLSYVSNPLDKDMDIVGKIQAKLWVESDAPDTCFTIKVMEVFPDGKAYNIRNGITTLGFRNGADTFQPYIGGPLEITIKCWDIAWRVKKGSRIRVDISSSNFPEYSIHPNTATVWSKETDLRIAHQTILSGKSYPSKLVLPVMAV